jgi:hypothetical protein
MATMGVRGGVASMGALNQAGSIPNAPAVQAPRSGLGGFTLDFSQSSTWVGVLFVGSVAYLLGAHIMLGRYRLPV